MTDFQRIVTMKALSSLGIGLVNVFLPIYLLENGYAFDTVIMWLLVHHLSLLVSVFVVVYVAQYIGLIRCWYIRLLLLAALFGGLATFVSEPYIVFLLALVSGASEAFFWIPYNVFLVRTTSKDTMGTSLALLQNVTTMVSMFVPLVAAVTIVVTGYDTLFILAVLLVGASLVPIMSLREGLTEFDFSVAKIKEVYQTQRVFFIPEMITSIIKDGSVVWQLFIFVTALTVLDIGVLGTLVSIAGVIVTFILGKLTDAAYRERTLRIGALFSVAVWALSYAVGAHVPNPALLYGATVLQGFAVSVFGVAYGSYIFNRARSDDVHRIALREVPTVFGRVVLFVVTLTSVYMGQIAVVFLFVATAAGYFLYTNLRALE